MCARVRLCVWAPVKCLCLIFSQFSAPLIPLCIFFSFVFFLLAGIWSLRRWDWISWYYWTVGLFMFDWQTSFCSQFIVMSACELQARLKGSRSSLLWVRNQFSASKCTVGHFSFYNRLTWEEDTCLVGVLAQYLFFFPFLFLVRLKLWNVGVVWFRLEKIEDQSMWKKSCIYSLVAAFCLFWSFFVVVCLYWSLIIFCLLLRKENKEPFYFCCLPKII